MRAKLSTTADATYSSYAPPARSVSDFFGHDTNPGEQAHPAPRSGNNLNRQALQRAERPTQDVPSDLRGEGLLHDARNLVSAIGLYCDLLSMPGVLKPEHKQYPEELRLLGTRSRVLIEHLLRTLVNQNLSHQDLERSLNECPDEPPAPLAHTSDLADRRNTQPISAAADFGTRSRAISLRSTVERCFGLLSRVANGRPVEVVYGAAADAPVWISEEAIERILVNLVRNACQALDREPCAVPTEPASDQHALPQRRHRRPGSPTLPGSRSAIRILVGPLERIGQARSWPFQHVRLVVEDSGCGITQQQLHSLISAPMASSRGTHGIGFRVVRELVAASSGELRAASTPGIGTRIQIEWPVAAASSAEKYGDSMKSKREPGNRLTHHGPATQLRLIPPATQPSATTEGRPGIH